jgi:hypothetical protein
MQTAGAEFIYVKKSGLSTFETLFWSIAADALMVHDLRGPDLRASASLALLPSEEDRLLDILSLGPV